MTLENKYCPGDVRWDSRTYEVLPGIYIQIVSDSAVGTMEDYFSRCILSTPASANSCTVIYNLSRDYGITQPEHKTNRMKHLKKGYYNLHHFGESVVHFCVGGEYFFIGRVQDCNKAIWSFFIKWLLTFQIAPTCTHIKGTVIRYNGLGVLLLGDKGSGKSTLVYELSRMSSNKVDLLANTHVVIDANLNARGLYSSINFREKMARKIQDNTPVLSTKPINGCTNIDPQDLDYQKIDQCHIDVIAFYQHNSDKAIRFSSISEEDMLRLIQTFSYAISFYSLQTDFVELCNGDINKVLEKLQSDMAILEGIVKHARRYSINCDAFVPNNMNEFIRILEGEESIDV